MGIRRAHAGHPGGIERVAGRRLDSFTDGCYSSGMATRTIDAVYEHGVVKPRRKLPFRDHAVLKLTITLPSTPVSRTRGVIRVSPRTARAIIHGDESAFYGG